jgi:hypothetical protein
MNVRFHNVSSPWLKAAVASFAGVTTQASSTQGDGSRPNGGLCVCVIDENTEQNHSSVNRDSSVCTDLKGESSHMNKLTKSGVNPRYSENSN